MCTEEQLAEAGVTKGMIRISVGLEEVWNFTLIYEEVDLYLTLKHQDP